MKKLISLFLIIIIFISTTACDLLSKEIAQKFNDTNGETDDSKNSEIIELTRTFYQKYNESGAGTSVVTSYEGLTLSDESANKYPLIKNILSSIIEENNSSCLSSFYDLTSMAYQFSSMPDMTLYSHSNVFVRRADSRILSLLFTTDSYSGGAHGSYYFEGKSIDVQSGKELSLRDMTNDVQALSKIIYNKLMENYTREHFFDAEAVDEYIFEQFDSLEWVADYNGITVIFNHYEIAPYASGSQIVMIPYDEIPGLKNDEYKKTPKSYAVELAPYMVHYFSLDDDDILNKLNIYYAMENSYEPVPITLNVDDAEITLSDYSYDSKAILVHMNKGENYMYTQVGIEETNEIHIHKLSSFGAKKLHIFDGSLRYMYDMDTELGSQKVFTNPMSFELSHMSSVISTVNSYRSYFVNKEGIPQHFADQNLYIVDSDWGTKYTLLRPLEVEIIDSKTGKVKETKTLKEGDKLTYYRTDSEKICDLKLSDGKIARIEIDVANTWPRTINGVNIEEIFEGIEFAG